KVLRFTNGTQVHFITPTFAGAVIGKRLLPDKITDRNGNFITIVNGEIVNENGVANNSHDWGIDYVLDTLGRKIDFYYESNVLTKVREQRGASWYDYVNIYYAQITISTNFSGLATDPSTLNGTQIWQPWYIEYPNLVNHRIFYTSYGQMYSVEKWVPTIGGQGSERPIAFTRYDMPSVGGYAAPTGPMTTPGGATAQTDCPKFSLRQEYAENWSPTVATPGWTPLTVWGSSTVYVTQYSYEFNIAGNYSKVIDPIDRVFRTDVSTDGLTHTSKTYANQSAYASGTPLKTVTITYEKDGGLSYTSNLRFTTTVITDGSFRGKTGYVYQTIAGVTLPYDVAEYENGGPNIYRHTTFIYNPDSTYIDRRIIGLPAEIWAFQGPGDTGTNQIGWKIFAYDEAS